MARRAGRLELASVGSVVGLAVFASALCARGADAAPAAAPTAPPPSASAQPDPATVKPPRPPPFAASDRSYLPWDPNAKHQPWDRHVDIGPDLAFVSQPASHDATGAKAAIHYGSAFGLQAHATWWMLEHLQFSVYFLSSDHTLHISPNALGLGGQIASDALQTYSFGARLQPALALSPRVRGWISAGIGWQRFNFPRMEVQEPGSTCAVNTFSSSCYTLYERNNSMAIFPFGAGASFDVIARWLAVVVEFSGAVPAWQGGTAVDTTRVVDNLGHGRTVGGLPLVDATLVETLGLSLIL